MAIKKLHVNFELDVELFARMLMNAGNMNIEVYGDAHSGPQRMLKGKAPLALPAPKKRLPGGIRKFVLEHMAANKETVFLPRELASIVAAHGGKPTTIHGVLNTLRINGLVRRKAGRYQVTAKALTSNGGTDG